MIIMIQNRSVLSCLLIIILSFSLIGCQKSNTVLSETRLAMGTLVEIKVAGNDERKMRDALRAAFSEIERIEQLMSSYREDSEISKLNREAGQHEVIVSNDTFGIIETSLCYSKLTGGAFDITVAPLLELWGFRRQEGRVPQEMELREVLDSIGYSKVRLDETAHTVGFEKAGVRIDLGAVAKGYAVDCASRVLEKMGVSAGLVNAGGDIYAWGSPPGKEDWEIGVQHPRNKEELLTVILLNDKAVATSGDYEKFFVLDGKRYSHIINPVTGRPVTGILSVTVVAETAMQADILSTSIFVLGKGKGLQLIRQFEEAEALIVYGTEDNWDVAVSSSGYFSGDIGNRH